MLEEVLALYRGELLPGIWKVVRRERRSREDPAIIDA
jgi:hypothetical protein